MKLHGDTTGGGYVANGRTEAVRLTTEPNDDDESIKVQVAEMGDGSLNIVIAGEVANTISRDSRGNPMIRIWPTTKKSE